MTSFKEGSVTTLFGCVCERVIAKPERFWALRHIALLFSALEIQCVAGVCDTIAKLVTVTLNAGHLRALHLVSTGLLDCLCR